MKISQSTGQIDWKMRKTLVVWLVQVHKEYNLQPETLQLAVNFLDRYCSVAPVLRSHYQLLGIVCLWIAAKYEENYGRVPNVKNLSFMCCDSYSERQFTLCENQVLRVLDFNLGHPTAESFLKRLLALNPHVFTNPESAALARFISELALPQHHFVGVAPSVIAQAALLLAFQISNAHPGWRVDTEIEYTRSQLLDCILDAPAPILAKYATLNYYSCSLVAQDWCRANLRLVFILYLGKVLLVDSILLVSSLRPKILLVLVFIGK